jgi:hypothetical protein
MNKGCEVSDASTRARSFYDFLLRIVETADPSLPLAPKIPPRRKISRGLKPRPA